MVVTDLEHRAALEALAKAREDLEREIKWAQRAERHLEHAHKCDHDIDHEGRWREDGGSLVPRRARPPAGDDYSEDSAP